MAGGASRLLSPPHLNSGQEWRPKGQPEPVNTYEFVDPELGNAIPYGFTIWVATRSSVSVGTDHDTAAFAVAGVA